MAKLNLKSLVVSAFFFGIETRSRLFAPILIGCTGKEALEANLLVKEVMMEVAREGGTWTEVLMAGNGPDILGRPEYMAAMRPVAARLRWLGETFNKPLWCQIADLVEEGMRDAQANWERRQGKVGGLEAGSLDEWIVRVSANRPVTAAEDLWTYLLEDIYSGAKIGEHTLWDAYLCLEEYAVQHGLDTSCTALAGLKECCRIPYRA